MSIDAKTRTHKNDITDNSELTSKVSIYDEACQYMSNKKESGAVKWQFNNEESKVKNFTEEYFYGILTNIEKFPKEYEDEIEYLQILLLSNLCDTNCSKNTIKLVAEYFKNRDFQHILENMGNRIAKCTTPLWKNFCKPEYCGKLINVGRNFLTTMNDNH
jgi:hypothetical protein